jgi:hypothetical protein
MSRHSDIGKTILSTNPNDKSRISGEKKILKEKKKKMLGELQAARQVQSPEFLEFSTL